jgi:uncharacterized RDD family membrane protein YckC
MDLTRGGTEMAQQRLAWARISAWCIDWLMVIGLSAMFNVMGLLASSAYWLLRDGLFDGQSVGKRLMGLQVLGPDGARSTWQVSAARNVLWIIPFVNVATGLTGLYYLFHDPTGRHWGDRLANSRVVQQGGVR